MSDKKLEKWLQDNHPEYLEILKERRIKNDTEMSYHNKNIASLLRKESRLRDQLSRATTRERIELEKQIDEIQDTIKNDNEYQRLRKEANEIDARFEKYVKQHFTYKEKVEYLGLSPYEGFNYFTEKEKEQYIIDDEKANNAVCRGILLVGLAVIVIMTVAAIISGQI